MQNSKTTAVVSAIQSRGDHVRMMDRVSLPDSAACVFIPATHSLLQDPLADELSVLRAAEEDLGRTYARLQRSGNPPLSARFRFIGELLSLRERAESLDQALETTESYFVARAHA